VGATLTQRIRAWRPGTPPLPEDLARLVKADYPEWFAREMAIAAAPPWWFWRFVLRNFSWLVSIFGRVEVTGGIPEGLRDGPLRSRPTTSATSTRSSSPWPCTRWA
jgi:1-acyl-sn-glycerol-3-phosphate acyltransferase